MIATPRTPLSYRQDGEYRFELTEPFRVKIDGFAGRTGKATHMDFGTSVPGAVGEGSWEVWARLEKDGELSIFSGYAWDGCSPAWQFAGRWWGTPTPEATRAACLVHDALYQFLDKGSWTRSEADAVFLALMKSAGFRLAPIYYGAVRIFGGIHHFFFR